MLKFTFLTGEHTMLLSSFIYIVLVLNIKCSSVTLEGNEVYGYIALGAKKAPVGSASNSYSFIVYKATISTEGTHPQLSFISDFSLLLFRINKGILQTTYPKFEEQDFSMDVLSDLTGTKYEYVGGPVKYTLGNVEAPKVKVYQDLNFELPEIEYSNYLSAKYATNYFQRYTKAPQHFCLLTPFLKKENGLYIVQNESDTDMSPYGECVKFQLQVTTTTDQTNDKAHLFVVNGMKLINPRKKDFYSKIIRERNFFTYRGSTFNLAKYDSFEKIEAAKSKGDELKFIEKIDDLFVNKQPKIKTPKRPLRMYSFDFWEYISKLYTDITLEKMVSIVTEYPKYETFVQYAVKVAGAPKEKMYVVGASMCGVTPNEPKETKSPKHTETKTGEIRTDEVISSKVTKGGPTNSTESNTGQQKNAGKLGVLNMGLIAAVIGMPIILTITFYIVLKKKLSDKKNRLQMV